MKALQLALLLSFSLTACGGGGSSSSSTGGVTGDADYRKKHPWYKTIEEMRSELAPHRAKVKEVVTSCVGEAEPNKTYRVSYPSRQLCVSPDVYWGNDVKYLVSGKPDGTAAVKLSLGLRPKSLEGSRARELEMLESFRSCIPHVRDFYARYGITLDLSMDEYLGQEVDNIVDVHESATHFGGGSSNDWGIGVKYPKGPRDAEACMIQMHEIGHLLGLPDEYADRRCPNREYVEKSQYPYSIMDLGPSIETNDLFPRHVKTILRPLCPSKVATENWPWPMNFWYR